jgi:hypothetical protein
MTAKARGNGRPPPPKKNSRIIKLVVFRRIELHSYGTDLGVTISICVGGTLIVEFRGPSDQL